MTTTTTNPFEGLPLAEIERLAAEARRSSIEHAVEASGLRAELEKLDLADAARRRAARQLRIRRAEAVAQRQIVRSAIATCVARGVNVTALSNFLQMDRTTVRRMAQGGSSSADPDTDPDTEK